MAARKTAKRTPSKRTASRKRKSYAGVPPLRVEGAPLDIAHQVALRMTNSRILDARRIVVEVSRQTVSLKGWVPTSLMANRAADIVRRVQGVRLVRNHLASGPHGGGDWPDEPLATGPHGGGEPPSRGRA